MSEQAKKLISQIEEIRAGDFVLRPNAIGEPSEVYVVRVLIYCQDVAVVVWSWNKSAPEQTKDLFNLVDGVWIYSQEESQKV